jgi:Spy/CpxP family protein refolding chaperone
MKRTALWISALLSLALLCPPALAAPGAEGGRKAKKARAKRDKGARKRKPTGGYMMMISVLKLDQERAAKITAIAEKYRADTKAWDAENGAKLKELMAAGKKAREDKDREKMKAIGGDMKKLRQGRDDIAAAEKKEVMALLTEDEKVQWAGFSLYRGTIGRYKKLNLTEEQDAKIREICTAAAKDMPDKSDRKAAGAARKKLAQDIEKVLTPEQVEQLKKKPEKKARQPKERKPRAKKGKAKRKGDQPVVVE